VKGVRKDLPKVWGGRGRKEKNIQTVWGEKSTKVVFQKHGRWNWAVRPATGRTWFVFILSKQRKRTSKPKKASNRKGVERTLLSLMESE